MEFKEDIKEAKERMNAWWDHEIIDRPIIAYYIPKKRGLGGYLDAVSPDWYLAQNPDNIEFALDRFEKRAKKTIFGGEAIPNFYPKYGPVILAAVFGAKPVFQSGTVWLTRPTEPNEIIGMLESVKLNQNNEWYTRLKQVTEKGSERASKMGYQFSISALGGILDILSSFLGPTKIILTMKRNPEIINVCRKIILEKLLQIYDELYEIIKRNCDGFNCWLNLWCGKSWYPVQSDFSAMLNPKWFKKFVLPDINTQIEHMEYAIYHLDGLEALKHLDELLEIETLTGIQWVPGAGKSAQGTEEWIPIYKKIQKAGKNIVIDTPPENVTHLFKVLDPLGLFIRTYYPSVKISKFHLPKFMGGEGGVLIDKAIDWVKSNNYTKMNLELVNLFLKSQNLIYDGKTKRELLKHINNSMIKKPFFA